MSERENVIEVLKSAQGNPEKERLIIERIKVQMLAAIVDELKRLSLENLSDPYAKGTEKIMEALKKK